MDGSIVRDPDFGLWQTKWRRVHEELRKSICIRSGMIDEDSAAIVRAKSCLAASRQETVARKAARDLFTSLSAGEQYITTAQLERRIREICSTTLRKEAEDSDNQDDESPEKLPVGAPALEGRRCEAGDVPEKNGMIHPARSETPDDETDACEQNDIRNLTVDNLVSAAVHYCQGELPLVSYELTLTDPSVKALDHIPLLQRAFLHPLVFLQILYLKILYHFGTFTFRLSNIELSVILLAYISFNMDNLYNLVLLLLYYLSFVAMVICTFKILYTKRQFIDFRKWSGLFLRYSDGNLQTDESENLFVRNNLGPFVQFFISLLVNLSLYPFISTQWVPFSEFCVISFSLMFLTLINFCTNGGPFPDILALMSFSISVLAKYPYEKDTVVHQGWRFLDLHISNYPSYILGNSIEFCLNARVFLSLQVPIVLLIMARRSNWQGFFKYTLPHCVTLSWLQMFIACSQGCTTYGLIRGTLALVCSFLFVPLIGVLTLTLPIFAFLQCITISRYFFTLSVMFGVVSSLAITCLLVRSEVTKRFVAPFQLTVALLTIIYLGNQIISNMHGNGLSSQIIDLMISDGKPTIKNFLKTEFIDYEENNFHISLPDYYMRCHSPAWSVTNMAETQIKCSVLDNTNVHWEGYVKQVKVINVKNIWSELAGYLPHYLEEMFKCYYGEEYSRWCQHVKGFESSVECEFARNVARQIGRSCHLNSFNEYTYEVRLQMDVHGGLLSRRMEISVMFDHQFTNITQLLREDDKISFRGVLNNQPGAYNLGSGKITVRGYELACMDCKETSGTISNKVSISTKFSKLLQSVANDLALSTKYVLNFMFNPVLVFK